MHIGSSPILLTNIALLADWIGTGNRKRGKPDRSGFDSRVRNKSGHSPNSRRRTVDGVCSDVGREEWGGFFKPFEIRGRGYWRNSPTVHRVSTTIAGSIPVRTHKSGIQPEHPPAITSRGLFGCRPGKKLALRKSQYHDFRRRVD